ncbi:hypothetical protein Pelo_494 [Pelomyxa schiedti]|nr:hypothetical protein Pelo_494 [Pelomyxa schiedti]
MTGIDTIEAPCMNFQLSMVCDRNGDLAVHFNLIKKLYAQAMTMDIVLTDKNGTKAVFAADLPTNYLCLASQLGGEIAFPSGSTTRMLTKKVNVSVTLKDSYQRSDKPQRLNTHGDDDPP